uniref:Oxidoreductase FAD/NAD(P)-binding domain-containing protein n=1 Tax=Ditylenchus dipsaci TaxID=166011 RepID=A0A915CS93_9BILA
MITGGVGITPMLSIIRRVFGAYEKTEVSLFYSNKTEKDILFREELDECAKEHPQQFNLYLTLTQADTELVDWKNFTGRFDKDILSKVMPSIEDGCSEDVLILVSGQKKMIKSAWHLCEQLGYANIWKC